MSDPVPPSGERLDSWKAIADYLHRDPGTVRRWERTLALPVRRVPGRRGHSVFAYVSEIEAWLKTTPLIDVVRAESAAVAHTPALLPMVVRLPWLKPALGVWVPLIAIMGALAAGAWLFRSPKAAAGDLRIEVTPESAVALDIAGAQQWRHVFPPAYRTALPAFSVPWRILAGPNAAVYVATSHRERRTDSMTEGGELLWLSPADGKPQRSFAFSDRVTLNDVAYAPPWAITAFAVDDSGVTRRTAVAAHHFEWAPSLVAILDDRWQRRGTFVHDGWIEAVHWLAPNRLLIGGFSEAGQGGMVALLDPAALELPRAEPRRIVVMPRTEINRVTASSFNRALVQVTRDRIIARTIEVLVTGREAVDALYEFSPALDLLSARFSERYWEIHRALEAQGKLNHSREQCPDRDGPREILEWESQTGWRTLMVR